MSAVCICDQLGRAGSCPIHGVGAVSAANRLRGLIGSAAFEALEAYLNDRQACCVGEDAPELLAPHLPVGVDAAGNLVNGEGRVITRTLTDAMSTKDGAA